MRGVIKNFEKKRYGMLQADVRHVHGTDAWKGHILLRKYYILYSRYLTCVVDYLT